MNTITEGWLINPKTGNETNKLVSVVIDLSDIEDDIVEYVSSYSNFIPEDACECEDVTLNDFDFADIEQYYFDSVGYPASLKIEDRSLRETMVIEALLENLGNVIPIEEVEKLIEKYVA